MSVLDVCDELAALFEPDPTLRDDTRWRPSEYEPELLYLWPSRVVYTLVSQGYEDEQRFVVQVAWAFDRANEGPADRDVSDAIDVRASAIRDKLAAVAGQGETFEQAHVDEVIYDGLSTLDVRGFTATVSGYRIRR